MSTVVYGITASTDMFVRSEFNNDDNIYACTSGGEEFMGETAISLQALSELENKQDLRVVICSEFVLDILNSLQNIGISIEQSFFFNHTSGQLVPCAELLADKADGSNSYNLEETSKKSWFSVHSFASITLRILFKRLVSLGDLENFSENIDIKASQSAYGVNNDSTLEEV